MKIRRIQITIEPAQQFVCSAGYKTFTVQARVDGRVFSTSKTFNEDDFQDIFGHIMKDAERCIRDMAAGHEDTLDILDKLP